MFTSLRSRLWLSYLLVISLVLLVVILALLLFLVRNPRLTRLAESNLLLAANTLQRQRVEINVDSDLSIVVQRADELLDVRVLIYSAQGSLLADSRAETEAAFPALQHFAAVDRPVEVSDFQDSNNKVWLYTRRNVARGLTMLVATQRPRAPILSILSDEFFLPILRAGGLALLLSILLSFLMARWIADPLQQISTASQEIGKGKVSQIEPSGPREVQSLARAFNAMSSQLNASLESQRDFVANVSHELKTPLTSVRGFAQAILDGTVKGGVALQQAGQVIFNEANRMHRLVVDLLDLARLDAGTAELKYSPVDISNLLRGVIERFTPQAQSAKITMEMDFPDLPRVSGDPDRLSQVFTNLVENALNYTSKGGRVRLTAERKGDFLEVSVSDAGRGIPKEETGRIFERFYQVDKSRRAGHGHGAGLGLPIARQIVQAHGGDISVESLIGEGNRFLVRLPMNSSQSGQSQA